MTLWWEHGSWGSTAVGEHSCWGAWLFGQNIETLLQVHSMSCNLQIMLLLNMALWREHELFRGSTAVWGESFSFTR